MSSKKSGSLDLFGYKPDLAGAVAVAVCTKPPWTVDTARPLDWIASILDSIDLVSEEGASPFEVVYYALMAGRKALPSFFPVHDICLLAANLLLSRLAKGQPLVLLDWGMLPVAALVAQAGVSVTLPANAAEGEERAIASLVKRLRGYLPKTEWNTPKDETALPEGCLVLGQHPLQHGERDPRFLEKLKGISGGIFYASWDFLGVKIYAHTRSLWLKNGLLRSVFQLPRPRRQTAAEYPALVELGVSDPKRKLRMARVAAWGAGPGALDQSAAVALLVGPLPVESKDALDISPETVAQDGLFDLSPSAHLARQKEGGPDTPSVDRVTLRQCAKVLHCQLPREKLDEETIKGLWLRSDGENWGEGEEGSFIAREVALAELDPLTGFLNEKDGNIVQLQLTLLGKQGKYVLKANDILFVFRGASSSIGKVGFVEDEGLLAIAGRTMCVIRCLPGIEPVWLYYYLQKQSVRDWVRARASGNTLLTINLESIRDMPIELSGLQNIGALINEDHQTLVKKMSVITGLRGEMDQARRRIKDRLGDLDKQ